MPKTAYHISLKGYVGGYDFDRSTVDRELAKNEGKQVNVLIDSRRFPRHRSVYLRSLQELRRNLCAFRVSQCFRNIHHLLGVPTFRYYEGDLSKITAKSLHL